MRATCSSSSSRGLAAAAVVVVLLLPATAARFVIEEGGLKVTFPPDAKSKYPAGFDMALVREEGAAARAGEGGLARRRRRGDGTRASPLDAHPPHCPPPPPPHLQANFGSPRYGGALL